MALNHIYQLARLTYNFVQLNGGIIMIFNYSGDLIAVIDKKKKIVFMERETKQGILPDIFKFLELNVEDYLLNRVTIFDFSIELENN